MNRDLHALGRAIRNAMLTIKPPTASRRPSTGDIYQALKAARSQIRKRFGNDVKCRYRGCPPVKGNKYCKRPLKVLEYLWDFSFSRFDIPRAIEQCGRLSEGERYELLFVAESELGSSHEVCRDLLKLLEARTHVRCLVYNQCKQSRRREQLHERMLRVLRSHAFFDPQTDEWLFVGLTWRRNELACGMCKTELEELLERLRRFRRIRGLLA